MKNLFTYFLHCYIAVLQYQKLFEVWYKRLTSHFLELNREALYLFVAHVIIVFDGNKLRYLPHSQNKSISQILRAGHNAHEKRVQSRYK
jgi:hypothetical protein